MLNWIRYQYQLTRCHTERWRTQRVASKLSRNPEVSLYELSADHWVALQMIEDNTKQLLSTYYESEAERLGLLVPPFDLGDDDWEQSDISGRRRLSRAAILKLRSAIRTEKKERSELFRAWLTSITGLIGVLIGLAAVILGRK